MTKYEYLLIAAIAFTLFIQARRTYCNYKAEQSTPSVTDANKL